MRKTFILQQSQTFPFYCHAFFSVASVLQPCSVKARFKALTLFFRVLHVLKQSKFVHICILGGLSGSFPYLGEMML